MNRSLHDSGAPAAAGDRPPAAAGSSAGIEVRGLSMVFADGTVALDDLDLAIDEGEFVVLVGPSGCGKSTALRILAGLERPSAGTVRIKGRDVTNESPQSRDVAMVFQNYALYPHKSVFENLAYPLRVRGLTRGEIGRQVVTVAELLAITPLLKRRPSALSGGQRQRVAMGRALVREPAAFLMDEPLSNLDAALRVGMRAEIRRLHQRLGVTTIYVTHDQVEAMTMGDRVAVLRDGILQQFAAPQLLYEQPANVFVASFIGSPAINLATAELDQASGEIHLAGLTITLPEARRQRLPKGPGRRSVIVGIRPETFSHRRDPEHDVDLEILPDFIESLGAELFVHFLVAARPVPEALISATGRRVDRPGTASGKPPASDAPFLAKLDARSACRAGQPATLWFSTDHLLVFDAATGAALLSSASLLEPP